MTPTTPCIEYGDEKRINDAGYARVPFGEPVRDSGGRSKGRRRVMLHRWIVEQVEGVPLAPWPAEIVMHLCDNPRCFRYDHLQRATPLDNNQDAQAKGRAVQLRGGAHPNAKLTAEQVDIIRTVAAGRARYGRKRLAARFGVSESTVKQVVAGSAWKTPMGSAR